MMTREEVTEVEVYCQEHSLTYKARLEELGYIQVDESTVPVIDNEKHRAVKGYMWDVLDCNTGMNFFHYDNGSRSKETARKLLCNYRGSMQCDGYDAYDQFETMGIKVLACWAHVRRKYTEALEENARLATEAIVYSLISCCKSADIDPRIWLEDVLNRMPLYVKEGKNTSELLPHHWKVNFAPNSGK